MPALDYSRFDAIGEVEEAEDRRGDAERVRERRIEMHRASERIIADWLRASSPLLDADSVAETLRFIRTQHRGPYADNRARAAEVVALLEVAGAPSAAALVALVRYADEKWLSAASGAGANARDAESTAERVLDVAMCALNTLEACAALDDAPRGWLASTPRPTARGARKLFDALHAGNADLARRYRDKEFARDALQRPAELELPNLPPPQSAGSVWSQLRLQLALAVFALLATWMMTSGLGGRLPGRLGTVGGGMQGVGGADAWEEGGAGGPGAGAAAPFGAAEAEADF